MAAPLSAACLDAAALFKNELQGNGSAYTWLETELRRLLELEPAKLCPTLGTAYATAGRKFGMLALTLGPNTQARLAALDLGQPLWSEKEAARASLLLALAAVTPSTVLTTCVRDLFYKGDTDERIVVLRCLTLLPDATQYDLVATDAVRSHVQGVFEAIACNNPYPERYFNESAFNQLVMKAYFNGVAVQRIVGLAQRRNADLTRMAMDFAAERRAAGRPIPADLELVTT